MSHLPSRRTASALVACTAVFALALPAAAASAGTAATAAVPCPKGQLFPFSSVLTNGKVKLGSSASVSNSSGTACGLITAGKNGLVGTVKPANTTFAAVTTMLSTPLGVLPVPTTLKATSNLTGPSTLGLKGVQAVLAGNVTATADIMGQKCDIPLKVKLTTGKSGSLTGKEFVVDKKGVQRGVLVDNRFTVPEIQPSATCNLVVATLSNKLLGLPLAAGASSIVYNATLNIH